MSLSLFHAEPEFRRSLGGCDKGVTTTTLDYHTGTRLHEYLLRETPYSEISIELDVWRYDHDDYCDKCGYVGNEIQTVSLCIEVGRKEIENIRDLRKIFPEGKKREIAEGFANCFGFSLITTAAKLEWCRCKEYVFCGNKEGKRELAVNIDLSSQLWRMETYRELVEQLALTVDYGLVDIPDFLYSEPILYRVDESLARWMNLPEESIWRTKGA